MDQCDEDQILNYNKFNKYHQFLKRTSPLVFSVSLFSLFLCYTSGFSMHPQSFNAYFSTCLFSMFTHTLERKYMFLICNGILAIIAKTSLMKSSPPLSSPAFDLEFNNNQEASSNNLSETNNALLVSSVPSTFESSELFQDNNYNDVSLMVEEKVLEQVKKQECNDDEEVIEAVEEQEDHETLNTEIEGKEEEEDESFIEETEGGVEDDEVAETTMTSSEDLANTEELNRKFEEFIRKMKEEIRIEAQRQLIAV
ncbi:hypothetical protein RIF29_40835 [Crotalaria pallida]|uniref:Uncharacterized protein n=1 Tax=Crotalaria pallida TaxID=3830 RepID=A0AAN9E487_CROPI